MTIAFQTFGCRLNRAEALDLEARLAAAGHTIIDLPSGSVRTPSGSVPTPSGSVPDAIIVRGCSVTTKAQRDCEKAIDHLRARFPTSQILITGCLPSAGTDPITLKSSPSLGVSAPLRDAIPVGSVPSLSGSVPTRTSRAYLKIQDGCSGKCAFCIVPKFRGLPTSVPFDEVLSRARAFLDVGYRELVVTGCNLALYRSQGHGLADVLSALAELNMRNRDDCAQKDAYSTGAQSSRLRIRLGSLEPGICDADILDAFERHPNICRFIHLSLQSGSDAILKRMNRPYVIASVAKFCAEAVSRLGPRLSLGADVITGFPGETDADHALTRAFFVRHAFTNLHVFPYSERPGTPAATMDGALSRAVRIARAHELEALGRRQRETFAQTFLNQKVEVCIEQGGTHGWTAEYLPCRLSTPHPRRSLVTVRVTAVNGDELIGTSMG